MLNQPKPSKQVNEAMLEGLMDIIYPQKVFTLGLADLRSGRIERAELAGWRFTGKLAGRDMCVHVGHSIRTKSSAVSRLTYGPYVSKCRDALRTAVESPEVSERDYELRLLSIPALDVEAVWLKSQTGKHDLMVPYLRRAGLTPLRLYPLEDFLGILQPKAENRLKFKDAPHRIRR